MTRKLQFLLTALLLMVASDECGASFFFCEAKKT